MDKIKRAIALGFFDGVHIGHAELMNRVKQRAEETDSIPSVLSFDIHPDKMVFGNDVELINSSACKTEIIRKRFGISDTVYLHFNYHLMHMPWDEFIDSLVKELNICWIVVGHDFSFGYKGAGNPALLTEYCREHNIGIDVIPAVRLDGVTVSSTVIRKFLKDGDIRSANRFLGHPHILADTVHSGYHLGTGLGAPTINMYFPPEVIVPKFGVYAAKVYLDNGKCYPAVTNIGVRPTVSDSAQVSVESHILNFDGNLYGRQVYLEFYEYIREEKKFASLEDLAAQIKLDTEAVKAYFSITSPEPTVS